MEYTEGIWFHDTYIKSIEKIVRNLYSYVQGMNHPCKKLMIVVNPKYREDPKTLQSFMLKESELKLKVFR